jgi:hypothetical protein
VRRSSCEQTDPGRLCRRPAGTFKQFLDAVDSAPALDPHAIRDHALSNYSLEATAPKYDEYFRRLQTLWGNGWYSRECRTIGSLGQPS